MPTFSQLTWNFHWRISLLPQESQAASHLYSTFVWVRKHPSRWLNWKKVPLWAERTKFTFLPFIHSPLNQPPFKVKVKVVQSCLTLCNPMDYTDHGILQVRILKWVSFPFSRGSSQSRNLTQVSCIAGRFFTSWATREAQTSPIGFFLFIAHSAWPIRKSFYPRSCWDSSPLGFHDLLPRLYSILVNQLGTAQGWRLVVMSSAQPPFQRDPASRSSISSCCPCRIHHAQEVLHAWFRVL